MGIKQVSSSSLFLSIVFSACLYALYPCLVLDKSFHFFLPHYIITHATYFTFHLVNLSWWASLRCARENGRKLYISAPFFLAPCYNDTFGGLLNIYWLFIVRPQCVALIFLEASMGEGCLSCSLMGVVCIISWKQFSFWSCRFFCPICYLLMLISE